ncbi:25466_t:CDS:2 [Racocetra persica]|uniref:25466_t:CDS:1 n=1 Tax=Racocetra persica TaxID=160502 RepID=A0ACA9N081_9GLOM|nr:25466_t:CDS:2 [Racocetra persica]
MEYAEDGSLHQYLLNNFENITWQDRIEKLYHIASGYCAFGKWYKNKENEDQFNDAEESRNINMQLKLITQELENSKIHPRASYKARPFDQIFGQHSQRPKPSNSMRHSRDKTLEIQSIYH